MHWRAFLPRIVRKNSLDDASGSYPLLTCGFSGTGLLAYVQFCFLPGQAGRDPRFRVGGESPFSAPKVPAIALIIMVSMAMFAGLRRKFRLGYR